MSDRYRIDVDPMLFAILDGLEYFSFCVGGLYLGQ